MNDSSQSHPSDVDAEDRIVLDAPQWQQAQAQYESATYPGDLAGELLAGEGLGHPNEAVRRPEVAGTIRPGRWGLRIAAGLALVTAIGGFVWMAATPGSQKTNTSSSSSPSTVSRTTDPQSESEAESISDPTASGQTEITESPKPSVTNGTSGTSGTTGTSATTRPTWAERPRYTVTQWPAPKPVSVAVVRQTRNAERRVASRTTPDAASNAPTSAAEDAPTSATGATSPNTPPGAGRTNRSTRVTQSPTYRMSPFRAARALRTASAAPSRSGAASESAPSSPAPPTSSSEPSWSSPIGTAA